MKLLMLISMVCLLNKINSLTSDEEISLNNISWLYAQFSLTFDSDEIISDSSTSSSSPSDSLVPLYNYFKSNPEVFDNYKSILAFFDIANLHRIVKSVSLNELERLLEERIKIHQNNIVSQDETPLTFKTFYAIFKTVENVIESEYPIARNIRPKVGWYHDENIPKITSITDVPQSHPLMQMFCHARSNNAKEIIRSLKQFQLRQFSSNTKLEKKEAKMLTLNHGFTEQLKGSKDPKPEKWTIHHMIPSKTIVEFYKNYFVLLSQKSSEMVNHKKFDWIKINEISVQKILLVNAETLWTKHGATIPVNNYDKNVNSRQEDFVRAWYRWPLGLLFYGPYTAIRSDDPSKKINKDMYNNQPNDFEAFAASIVGDEYFLKVKKLNTDILEFNKIFTPSSDVNVLNEAAMKIYNRLLTIHREAPWTNQIIAPFNTDGWKFNESDQKWSINQNYRPVWGEWGIKTLAQQLDVMLSTNNVNAGASTSFDKELRRRKRHHIEEVNCDAHLNDTPDSSIPENGFWCSPFYLRINTANYVVCKLLGHKNLKFFLIIKI